MTQFGQGFQAIIKTNLPNFVLAFFHRVIGYLKQNAYCRIASNINEIGAQKQNLGENYDKYVGPFILYVMARICFDLEKYKDVIKILNKTLLWQEKMLGEKHPLLGETLNNLAVPYAQEGKYENVKMLAERAMEIYVQPTCDGYPFVAHKLSVLARYFNNQGKHDEEEQCYIRALGICEANQSSDDSLVAAALNELAQCYLRRGKLRKAEKLFKNVLSKTCDKEFGDAGDKSSRLKRLAPKKIFKISKNGNESFTNIWQRAEERERNKMKVSEEVSPPVYLNSKLVSFYTSTFEVALNGLEAIYEKQGKQVAAKILNHYANQQLVAPQLPPKKRDIKASRTSLPLPSLPSSPAPPARENDTDCWSDCRIEMQCPPSYLPNSEAKPDSIDVSRENIPTLTLPSMQQPSPATETESSCANIPQRFMVLSSAPPAEEDESFAVPQQIRFLERKVAELQAQIAEKDLRLAQAERTIETHKTFRKICLDNDETGSGVAAVTSQLATSARNVIYVKKRTAAIAE